MESINNSGYNSPGPLTPEMEKEIAATHPWMRFIAIMAFIFLGLLLLGGFASVASGEAMVVVVVIIFMLILIFPVVFLLQSANSFKDYLATRDQQALLNAIQKSKAHWRYAGILLIISIVFQLISVVVLLVGGSMLFDFM